MKENKNLVATHIHTKLNLSHSICRSSCGAANIAVPYLFLGRIEKWKEKENLMFKSH